MTTTIVLATAIVFLLWRVWSLEKENFRDRIDFNTRISERELVSSSQQDEIANLREHIDALEKEVRQRAKHQANKEKAIIEALGGKDGPRWTLRTCDEGK